MCVCVCVCARACVRACVRVCVCVLYNIYSLIVWDHFMLPDTFTKITLLKHPKFSMSTWFMRAALSIFMWTVSLFIWSRHRQPWDWLVFSTGEAQLFYHTLFMTCSLPPPPQASSSVRVNQVPDWQMEISSNNKQRDVWTEEPSLRPEDREHRRI